jgi:hypothetical protein
MLSRVENHIALNVATPMREQVHPGASQAFMDLLAGETQSAPAGSQPQSATGSARPQIPAASDGQVSAGREAGRQILDTRPCVAPFRLPTYPSDNSTAVIPEEPTASPLTESTDAPFLPEFQQNLEVVSAYGGSSPLNPIYFATKDTAQWIANKYGTGEVVERPYGATGGPYSANGTEYYIKLQDGKLVNAGLLADYYQRLPESQFPGQADRIINEGLSNL